MEIFEVKLNKIQKGDVISLYTRNNDPQFGSIGNAEQHIKYLGNNSFEVIKSTRSLEKGMIISMESPSIKVYQQINFTVEKIPGMDQKELHKRSLLFRMRPVDRIEINRLVKINNNG